MNYKEEGVRPSFVSILSLYLEIICCSLYSDVHISPKTKGK